MKRGGEEVEPGFETEDDTEFELEVEKRLTRGREESETDEARPNQRLQRDSKLCDGQNERTILEKKGFVQSKKFIKQFFRARKLVFLREKLRRTAFTRLGRLVGWFE